MSDTFQHVRKAHRHFDATFKAARQQSLRHGQPVVTTCTKGCFSCCKEPVYSFEDEAAYILEALPPEELEGVKARLRVWLDKMVPSGIFNVKQPHVLLWRDLNAWCPLLKDGMCLAYDRRPLSCRSHMATGPRVKCDVDSLRAEQRYVYNVEACNSSTQMMLKAKIDTLTNIEADHLGLQLAKLLLGENIQSVEHFNLKEEWPVRK